MSTSSNRHLYTGIGSFVFIFFVFVSIQNFNIKEWNTKVKNFMYNSKNGNEDSKLKELLVQLSTDIRKAKTHIRGTKARKYIVNALDVVTKLLTLTNSSTEGLTRQVTVSKHICKEVFKGSKYGYSLYHTGFEREHCTYATPLEDIVTIVVLPSGESNFNIESILHEILHYNNRIKVIVGTLDPEKFLKNINFSKVQFLQISDTFTLGKAWNLLIEQVKTEYVLVARNITYFSKDSRIERLVHEIESLGVAVVGGASRDKDGFWKIGCYQSAYRNYTLVYEEGYDESLHECLFCDFLMGPFLIRTKTIKKYQFDENLKLSNVFNDLFLRLSLSNQESVVCPDSMFYVNRAQISNNSGTWSDLAKKYNLYRLSFANQVDITFECKNVECNKNLGYAVHPCCLQDLADMMKFAMKLCEKSGSICEIDSGSMIGVVKFYSVLPWEKDGDISFLSTNFSALSSLKKEMKKWYSVRSSSQFFQLDSKYWFIELFGMKQLDSVEVISEGFKPTKALIDGQWVWAPRNPGLWARNRYGHEIYAHAQHWRDFGKKDSWFEYQANYFAPCKTPGRHDCLNNINADGNLQFRTPLP